MANYNHEILVNYLRDVYSMELLVRKIEDDVHSTGEDVEYLQTLIEKADSTPVPQKGTISPPKDIFPSLAKGCVTLGILICLLLFSPDSGFLGLIAALCLYLSLGFFIYAGGIATVYKGNIIKNLIMDCQSYTKYRPNETTGGIFVSWRRKEELPTGA